MSNFLGGPDSAWVSPILSGGELMAREGANLTKGMNYREGKGLLSVFLVLPSHDGEFKDEWNPETLIYVYEGHDSTTVELGKHEEQLVMYESGRVSDNGKFYKAAHAFKDGLRKEPLQIQVYEKLDPGIWFDKGIFNLVDALREKSEGRLVFKFHLIPASAYETGELSDPDNEERMLSATEKHLAWKQSGGRCVICNSDRELRFKNNNQQTQLLCPPHRGASARGLLG